MNKILLILAFSCLALALKAQNFIKDAKEDTTVYTTVEIPPEFPGGEAALGKFFFNIHIPKSVIANGFVSRVLFNWVVEKDGVVSNIKILNNLPSEEKGAALVCLKSMPKWSPGMLNGHKVRVKMTVPIIIDIGDN